VTGVRPLDSIKIGSVTVEYRTVFIFTSFVLLLPTREKSVFFEANEEIEITPVGFGGQTTEGKEFEY
jgi:hypothetical protein